MQGKPSANREGFVPSFSFPSLSIAGLSVLKVHIKASVAEKRGHAKVVFCLSASLLPVKPYGEKGLKVLEKYYSEADHSRMRH